MYKTTFRSLDCVNATIGALENRRSELRKLIERFGDNYESSERRRLMNEVSDITSAIASLYDSEVYLPHLEPVRRVEEDAIPIKIEGWNGNA